MRTGETEGSVLSRNHRFPPDYAVHWMLLSENRHEKTLSDESKSVRVVRRLFEQAHLGRGHAADDSWSSMLKGDTCL